MRRIGQEFAQSGLEEVGNALEIDLACGEQPADRIRQAVTLRHGQRDALVAEPLRPAPPGQGTLDAEEGRALVPTEKGMNVIRLLDGHPLTQPALTGEWEHRLGEIQEGTETRKKFMADIKEFAVGTINELDTSLKDVKIPRANLGPCPVCGADIIENRKGYSCWAREDPGCGFVIWKGKVGKQLPAAIARELITTGRTEKQIAGFKGRSGRSFRAKLALQQSEEGKWRVEFDEAWAKEGAKAPAAEDATADADAIAEAEAAKAAKAGGDSADEAA